ncbi:hypothetical protein EON63_21655 [archaeon]|nr:MAG: hypothetical protein EON63_21655 [archaeon]
MLALRTMTVAEFYKFLRKKLDIQHSSKTLFLFIKNTLVPNTVNIQTLHDQYAEADGYLYVTYMEQDVFG